MKPRPEYAGPDGRTWNRTDTFETFLAAIETFDFSNNWHNDSRLTNALLYARHGWPEGTAQVKQRTLDLLQHIGHTEDRAIYDTAPEGFAPHIGNYLNGSPCSMITLAATPDRQVVRLGIALNFFGGIDASDITDRGALALSMIEALERANYETELWGTILNEWAEQGSGRYALAHAILLKRAGEYVDLDRLAFCLCHEDFNRRLHFNWRNLQPANVRARHGWDESGAMGRPFNSWPADHPVQPDILITSGRHAGTIIDPTATLKTELEKYGIVTQ